MNHGEKDHHFKLAQVAAVRHKFNNSEEIAGAQHPFAACRPGRLETLWFF
jgi:hypothetical protein